MCCNTILSSTYSTLCLRAVVLALVRRLVLQRCGNARSLAHMMSLVPPANAHPIAASVAAAATVPAAALAAAIGMGKGGSAPLVDRVSAFIGTWLFRTLTWVLSYLPIHLRRRTINAALVNRNSGITAFVDNSPFSGVGASYLDAFDRSMSAQPSRRRSQSGNAGSAAAAEWQCIVVLLHSFAATELRPLRVPQPTLLAPLSAPTSRTAIASASRTAQSSQRRSGYPNDMRGMLNVVASQGALDGQGMSVALLMTAEAERVGRATRTCGNVYSALVHGHLASVSHLCSTLHNAAGRPMVETASGNGASSVLKVVPTPAVSQKKKRKVFSAVPEAETPDPTLSANAELQGNVSDVSSVCTHSRWALAAATANACNVSWPFLFDLLLLPTPLSTMPINRPGTHVFADAGDPLRGHSLSAVLSSMSAAAATLSLLHHTANGHPAGPAAVSAATSAVPLQPLRVAVVRGSPQLQRAVVATALSTGPAVAAYLRTIAFAKKVLTSNGSFATCRVSANPKQDASTSGSDSDGMWSEGDTDTDAPKPSDNSNAMSDSALSKLCSAVAFGDYSVLDAATLSQAADEANKICMRPVETVHDDLVDAPSLTPVPYSYLLTVATHPRTRALSAAALALCHALSDEALEELAVTLLGRLDGVLWVVPRETLGAELGLAPTYSNREGPRVGGNAQLLYDAEFPSLASLLTITIEIGLSDALSRPAAAVTAVMTAIGTMHATSMQSLLERRRNFGAESVAFINPPVFAETHMFSIGTVLAEIIAKTGSAEESDAALVMLHNAAYLAPTGFSLTSNSRGHILSAALSSSFASMRACATAIAATHTVLLLRSYANADLIRGPTSVPEVSVRTPEEEDALTAAEAVLLSGSWVFACKRRARAVALVLSSVDPLLCFVPEIGHSGEECKDDDVSAFAALASVSPPQTMHLPSQVGDIKIGTIGLSLNSPTAEMLLEQYPLVKNTSSSSLSTADVSRSSSLSSSLSPIMPIDNVAKPVKLTGLAALQHKLRTSSTTKAATAAALNAANVVATAAAKVAVVGKDVISKIAAKGTARSSTTAPVFIPGSLDHQTSVTSATVTSANGDGLVIGTSVAKTAKNNGAWVGMFLTAALTQVLSVTGHCTHGQIHRGFTCSRCDMLKDNMKIESASDIAYWMCIASSSLSDYHTPPMHEDGATEQTIMSFMDSAHGDLNDEDSYVSLLRFSAILTQPDGPALSAAIESFLTLLSPSSTSSARFTALVPSLLTRAPLVAAVCPRLFHAGSTPLTRLLVRKCLLPWLSPAGLAASPTAGGRLDFSTIMRAAAQAVGRAAKLQPHEVGLRKYSAGDGMDDSDDNDDGDGDAEGMADRDTGHTTRVRASDMFFTTEEISNRPRRKRSVRATDEHSMNVGSAIDQAEDSSLTDVASRGVSRQDFKIAPLIFNNLTPSQPHGKMLTSDYTHGRRVTVLAPKAASNAITELLHTDTTSDESGAFESAVAAASAAADAVGPDSVAAANALRLWLAEDDDEDELLTERPRPCDSSESSSLTMNASTTSQPDAYQALSESAELAVSQSSSRLRNRGGRWGGVFSPTVTLTSSTSASAATAATHGILSPTHDRSESGDGVQHDAIAMSVPQISRTSHVVNAATNSLWGDDGDDDGYLNDALGYLSIKVSTLTSNATSPNIIAKGAPIVIEYFDPSRDTPAGRGRSVAAAPAGASLGVMSDAAFLAAGAASTPVGGMDSGKTSTRGLAFPTFTPVSSASLALSPIEKTSVQSPPEDATEAAVAATTLTKALFFDLSAATYSVFSHSAESGSLTIDTMIRNTTAARRSYDILSGAFVTAYSSVFLKQLALCRSEPPVQDRHNTHLGSTSTVVQPRYNTSTVADWVALLTRAASELIAHHAYLATSTSVLTMTLTALACVGGRASLCAAQPRAPRTAVNAVGPLLALALGRALADAASQVGLPHSPLTLRATQDVSAEPRPLDFIMLPAWDNMFFASAVDALLSEPADGDLPWTPLKPVAFARDISEPAINNDGGVDERDIMDLSFVPAPGEGQVMASRRNASFDIAIKTVEATSSQDAAWRATATATSVSAPPELLRFLARLSQRFGPRGCAGILQSSAFARILPRTAAVPTSTAIATAFTTLSANQLSVSSSVRSAPSAYAASVEAVMNLVPLSVIAPPVISAASAAPTLELELQSDANGAVTLLRCDPTAVCDPAASASAWALALSTKPTTALTSVESSAVTSLMRSATSPATAVGALWASLILARAVPVALRKSWRS